MDVNSKNEYFLHHVLETFSNVVITEWKALFASALQLFFALLRWHVLLYAKSMISILTCNCFFQVHANVAYHVKMPLDPTACTIPSWRHRFYDRCYKIQWSSHKLGQADRALVAGYDYQFCSMVQCPKELCQHYEWIAEKGIEYGPGATDDWVPHFLPGRLGAPPLFTICNN
jgi:hypothetical protein